MRPTIGRIVIFTPHNDVEVTPTNSMGVTAGEKPLRPEMPAMVTAVHSDRVVDLVAFAGNGAGPSPGFAQGYTSVELDPDPENPTTYHWHWPPRD